MSIEEELARLRNAVWNQGVPLDGYYGNCRYCGSQIEKFTPSQTIEEHRTDCVWLAEHNRRT